MTLTLAKAKRIADGAIEKAEELNIKIAAAVCDPGGRLLVLHRMDGAIWAGVYGSQGKAATSAAFGRASVKLAERADTPTMRGIQIAEGGHMIYGQGGIPIHRDDAIIGACGVGGGTGEQDEECAHAGIARL